MGTFMELLRGRLQGRACRTKALQERGGQTWTQTRHEVQGEQVSHSGAWRCGHGIPSQIRILILTGCLPGQDRHPDLWLLPERAAPLFPECRRTEPLRQPAAA